MNEDASDKEKIATSTAEVGNVPQDKKEISGPFESKDLSIRDVEEGSSEILSAAAVPSSLPRRYETEERMEKRQAGALITPALVGAHQMGGINNDGSSGFNDLLVDEDESSEIMTTRVTTATATEATLVTVDAYMVDPIAKAELKIDEVSGEILEDDEQNNMRAAKVGTGAAAAGATGFVVSTQAAAGGTAGAFGGFSALSALVAVAGTAAVVGGSVAAGVIVSNNNKEDSPPSPPVYLNRIVSYYNETGRNVTLGCALNVTNDLPEDMAVSINMTQECLVTLSNNPNVEYILEDKPVELLHIGDTSTASASNTVDALDAEHRRRLNDFGSGPNLVKICLVDSGIDATHEVFNGTEISGFPETTWNETFGCDHGTAMAGIFATMFPEAELFVYNLFDGPPENETDPSCGTATGIDVLVVMDMCIECGANVISLSLGKESGDLIDSRVMDRAVESGVMVVGAAGNDGAELVCGEANNETGVFPSNVTSVFPACYPNVVGVVAGDPSMREAWPRSDYGDGFVVAVGVDVMTAAPGSSFVNVTGSSAAAATFSVSAALLYSYHPVCTPEEILQAIRATAGDAFFNLREAKLYIDRTGCAAGTLAPTVSPVPSSMPSDAPSDVPSRAPSAAPTISSAPSDIPSSSPSSAPSSSASPTGMPSSSPSVAPTIESSSSPTVSPAPSASPSAAPSALPSVSPSDGTSFAFLSTVCVMIASYPVARTLCVPFISHSTEFDAFRGADWSSFELTIESAVRNFRKPVRRAFRCTIFISVARSYATTVRIPECPSFVYPFGSSDHRSDGNPYCRPDSCTNLCRSFPVKGRITDSTTGVQKYGYTPSCPRPVLRRVAWGLRRVADHGHEQSL